VAASRSLSFLLAQLEALDAFAHHALTLALFDQPEMRLVLGHHKAHGQA
jgi:hypothetical protein